MTVHVVMNGELMLAEHAAVEVLHPLCSFGEGALEVFRTTPHGAFLASRHLLRLKKTCRVLGIDAGDARADLIADLALLPDRRPRRVRLIRGESMRIIIAEDFRRCDDLIANGARVTMHEGVVTPLGVKTTSYAASRHHSRRARESGFDECVLLYGGYVLEGATSNILMVRDGVLISPDSAMALEGITLGYVVAWARSAGLGVERRRISVAELESADELIMTSAVRGPIPISAVDERSMAIGPVFKRLRGHYDEDLKMDWGELQEEVIAGNGVRGRLRDLGAKEEKGRFLYKNHEFALREGLEGLFLFVETPRPGAGPLLKHLAAALNA